MRKQIIAVVAAIGLAFAAASPAKAQFWGGYGPVGWGWGGGYGYGGWGGYGYGGYGAAMGIGMGAALVGGMIGGAIASSAYAPAYGYGAPVYAAPGYGYGAPRVRKNITIKNSPGARVYEEDDIFGGW